MHRWLAMVALATLLAGACSTAPGQLAGKEYLSVDVRGPRGLVPGTQIRLGFEQGNVSANAGCNTMGGTYRIEGGRLVFEGGGMTSMGCDADRHAQDEWLVAFLASRPLLTVAGADLRLDGGGTVITLRDREVVQPDANLVGPTWTVESIITGDAVASAPLDLRATIAFKADGTFELFAGCNRGGGSWSSTEAGIDLGPIMLTKMACDGPAAMLESSVLEVLDADPISASIDADVLTLQANGHGLQLRAG